MTRKVVLSVDAMGGDLAPKAVIEGIALFCKENTGVHFLIYGDSSRVKPLLESFPEINDYYEFISTKDVVADDEQPVRALKKGKQSSMRKAIDAVKDGIADACISSGNTGALMVMSKLVLGDITGISRPAITSPIPTKKGASIILDIGANVEADAKCLKDFAYMGVCYAKAFLKKENPTVALLNVGKEEIKGTTVLKEAYQLLQESNLNFKGFVEGFDIVEGKVDVVVTDGFSGNVIVKSVEGYVKFVMHKLKKAVYSNLITKMAGFLLKAYLKKELSILDPSEVNGAMFMGINGVVVKSHGSSGAKEFASAIGVAHDLVEKDVNEEIRSIMNGGVKVGGKGIVQKIKTKLGFTKK